MSTSLVTATGVFESFSLPASVRQEMPGFAAASLPSPQLAGAAATTAYTTVAAPLDGHETAVVTAAAVDYNPPPPAAVVGAAIEPSITAVIASPSPAPPAAPVATATPVPVATSTATSSPTAAPPTRTPVPPTATATMTPLPPTATPTARAVAPPPAINPLEQAMFSMHNSVRQSSGLPALQLDGGLVLVARQRAQDMATSNYFAHTSPTGQTAYTLLSRFGVPYGAAGENIARNNYPEAQSANVAMDGFMQSEGHRANIMDPRYRRVGIGYAVAPDGMRYFAVIFAD